MNKLKALGLVASGLGVAVSLISDYVNKKEMDEKIAEAVAKAVTKADK